MKKSVLLFGILVLSAGLMALNYMNKNQEEPITIDSPSRQSSVVKFDNMIAYQLGIEKEENRFFLDLGSRFRAVKRSDVMAAIGIEDFLTSEETKNVVSYHSLKIYLFENEERTSPTEAVDDSLFSDSQLSFLRSMDHSTNFVLESQYKEKITGTSALKWGYTTPHLTVVPESQAEYMEGMGAFYNYIREGVYYEMENTEEESLAPAKLYFILTKEGEVEGLRLMRSSNDPAIDKKIIELVETLPGNWKVARDENKQPVDQELVLSFGGRGC